MASVKAWIDSLQCHLQPCETAQLAAVLEPQVQGTEGLRGVICCHSAICLLSNLCAQAKDSGGMDMCAGWFLDSKVANQCRLVADWLTKRMLIGLIKGPGHVGQPEKFWDNVLSDVYHLSISHPYQVAQQKSTW